MSVRPNLAQQTRCCDASGGFTLIEMLIAITLTLILLTAVLQVFNGVGDGISKSRKAVEAFDRLRAAEGVLRTDLQGLTVTLAPPWRAEDAKGYFEYVESGTPPSPIVAPTAMILDPNDSNYNKPDTTVGQCGDMLMFTSRSVTRPFTGLYASGGTASTVIQSEVAEIAWFVRGHDLHRRVLLVAPGVTQNIAGADPSTFYLNNDISVHRANGKFVANSLSDLARRENRFAHPTGQFPFNVRVWGQLCLPTMRECADSTFMGANKSNWSSGSFPAVPSNNLPAPLTKVDLWQTNCASKDGSIQYWLPDWCMNLGPTVTIPTRSTPRDSDDVILTNVISFDVKAFDTGSKNYIDLAGGGGSLSGQATYDTFPNSYESEGIYHFNNNNGSLIVDTPGGASNNGFNAANAGTITAPPFTNALRGIQVKIRCFEPSSHQVREVTVIQDFLPR